MLIRPSDREILLALNTAPALSRPALCRLALELDRWSYAPAVRPESLAAELGVPLAALRKALACIPEAASAAAREEEAAARLGAHILSLRDPGFPAALRQLPLPPPILSVRGELTAGPMVAIVGSRRADAYGLEVAELFAKSLAEAGVTVVSGFARGIDAAAHRGALAGGGRTVAVLGCGLGVDYPRGHERLGHEIASGGGALISEFPCGREPRTWHFPVRNRVIAGLAATTLVVQAAPRSGSLITARHALDLGRDVYAVPGRIFDERSLGPNALIRDGAALVQHPRDLLDGIVGLPQRKGTLPKGAAVSSGLPAKPAADGPEPPPGLAGEIVVLLGPGSLLAPEEIAGRLDQTLDRILGALLELELEGWVQRMPGGRYRGQRA